MNEGINYLFISKILQYIPKNINPVNYLSDILKISSKSVYRRIKGEIPFTLTEIFALSKELNFSIDQILGLDKVEDVYFTLQADKVLSPEDAFKQMLQQYYEHTERLNRASRVESLMAMNHIPIIFTVFFDNLFKFSFYKWMHQNHRASLKYCFHDVAIPSEISSLKDKVIASSIKNDNITLIIDPNYILATIKEIRYYHKRKLLTDDEALLIRDDLFKMVDWAESLVSKGYIEGGGKINLYLLEFDLKVSSSYIEYDDIVKSNIMIYTVNPINIFNSKTFSEIHKRWFETIKKYSVLITQSNEVMQAQYLDKQRNYIENIFTDDPF